jgi:hypothetical protein
MLTITLQPDEVALLRFILESYLADLRLEIRETDSREFRAHLKQREQFLQQLLHTLHAEAGAQAS